MTNQLSQASDDAIYDNVGGGLSCPLTEFERWVTQNPVRRHTGVVVRNGRRMFDPKLARAQADADFARWKRSIAVAREAHQAEKQPVGRFFGRARRRAKRPTAAKPTATADPDGEPAAATLDASGDAS